MTINSWLTYLKNRSRLLFVPGSIRSNSILSIISLTAQFLSGFVVTLVFARFTTIDILGEILYAIAFVNLVMVLSSYGFDNLLIREISQGNYRLFGIVPGLLLAKLIVSIAVILITGLFIQLVGVPLANPNDLWWFVIAGILNSYVQAINAMRKGKNDFKTEAKVSVFRNISFSTVALVTAFVFGVSIRLVGEVRLLSVLLTLFLAIFWFIKSSVSEGADRGLVWITAFPLARTLLKVGFPFALHAFLVTSYFRMDVLVLGALKSSSEVGYFQAAMQVVIVAMMIPLAITQAFYPKIARSLRKIESTSLRQVKVMLRILGLVGLGLALFFGLLGPILMPLLYGPNIEESVDILRILSLVFLIRPVAGGLGICLLSVGLQKVQVLVGAVAVIGSISLNVALIPVGGAIAAAWVNVIINLLVLLIYYIWWKRIITQTENGYLKVSNI